MWMTSSNNKALNNLLAPSFTEVLIEVLDDLESTKSSIRLFTETRRAQFPRFFFLTDIELMEMLSNFHSHKDYSSHLSYIFPGVHKFYVKKVEAGRKERGEEVDVDIAPFNMFSPAGNELLDPF